MEDLKDVRVLVREGGVRSRRVGLARGERMDVADRRMRFRVFFLYTGFFE